MSTPTRSRFRFHLSTALVVSLVAAVLLYLNLHARMKTLPVDENPNDYCTVVQRGFPQTFHYAIYHRQDKYSGVNWYYGSLALDAGFMLAVLSAEAFVWEWLMRMKDARRHGT